MKTLTIEAPAARLTAIGNPPSLVQVTQLAGVGVVAHPARQRTKVLRRRLELQITLDVNAWDGAPGLASLYAFVLTELIGANIRRDADRVDSCRKLLEPLRDAWREAASAT